MPAVVHRIARIRRDVEDHQFELAPIQLRTDSTVQCAPDYRKQRTDFTPSPWLWTVVSKR